MVGESMNFSEAGVREVYSKVVNTLWNVVEFYGMFSDDGQQTTGNRQSTHVLDTWILARLNQLILEVTDGLDTYSINDATRPIMDFVLDLSQWYVRLSRSRFKKQSSVFSLQSSGDALEEDFQQAVRTLQHVLVTLSKIMAPFTPFIAEKVFQTTVNGRQTTDSVHLEEWPEVGDLIVGEDLLKQMGLARKIVEMGHSLRKESGIPVRQPLSELRIKNQKLGDDYENLVAQELNVKSVVCSQESVDGDIVEKKDGELHVVLVITVDDTLKKEGLLREIVRTVNQMRKEQGLTREDRVVLVYKTDDVLLTSVFVDFTDELKASVLADEVREGTDVDNMVEIDGRVLYLTFIRI